MALHLFLSFLPSCIASITDTNMRTKPPQVKKIWISHPEALLGNSASSCPVQWSSAQNQFPFPWHCLIAWVPSAFIAFGQGGIDRPVEVQFASRPRSAHGQQIIFQLPTARMAIGWKFVMIAERNINSVGRCFTKQVPRRVWLHLQ